MWFVIVNPESGGGSARRLWPRIERELQAQGFAYSVRFTERKMHAVELVEEAVARGMRNILAVGGDGTAHEVANGILRQDIAPSRDIGLALIPVGSGNDWAREWSLPASPVECLKRFKLEKFKFQDAGKISFSHDGKLANRFFINVAGMAYDAFVTREAERQGGPKVGLGGYYSLIVKCLWKFEPGPARLFYIEKDATGSEETLVEDSFYTINIGLCRYSGGGMQFVPQAVPDDGLFALTYARRMPKWEVVAQTPRFFNGKIGEHPKVVCTQARSVRVVSMAWQPPVLVEADGEFLGETPVGFEILPGTLKVFY